MARARGPGPGAGARGRCCRRRCCSVRRAAAPARCPGTGARTPSAPGSKRASRCREACTAAGPVCPHSHPVPPLPRPGRAGAAPTEDSQPQTAGLPPPPPWCPGCARTQGRGRGVVSVTPRRSQNHRRRASARGGHQRGFLGIPRPRCTQDLRFLNPGPH